jgi:hypothetical protein
LAKIAENWPKSLPVQIFVGQELPDDALGLRPNLLLFQVDGVVDDPADRVDQDVLGSIR